VPNSCVKQYNKKARKTDFLGFGEFSKNPFFGALRDIRLPSWNQRKN
jgi:hypothetical protein